MVIEKLKTILEKERVDDLIPFLKSLGKDDKKESALSFKALAKEYTEYREEKSLVGGSSFRQKGSPRQQIMIYATAFVCLNRKDYTRIDQFGHLLDNELLPHILPWYCPDWFSDWVNALTKRDWLPFSLRYDFIMGLTEPGYLKPSDELIVRLLPQMMFQRGTDHKFFFAPENLTKRVITLAEHFWLIFQFETPINYSDRYLQFHNSKKDVDLWHQTIKEHVAKGTINRNRVLKESILASARNFNKGLSGWFIELFEFLEPTTGELIALQDELFVAINSSNSKAVNAVLSAFKKLADADGFNATTFLENVPLLLSSEVKSVVSSALMLLEKIARKIPSEHERVCVQVCQAFIHSDEGIQTKAAKLVAKFHGGSALVAAEANQYADSLLMSSKKILEELVSEGGEQLANVETKTDTNTGTHALIRPLPEVKTMDELIFLASQAFDNNNPFHPDLLAAALVNLQGQLNASVLPKFEPALQRAYQTVLGDWRSTSGFLDHLVATFFIEVTKRLAVQHADKSIALQRLHIQYRERDEANKAQWSWYKGQILELKTWAVETGDTTYFLHRAILILAYRKIENWQRLPILSTPTHEHGYLDPMVFVQRLAQYQSKGELPDNYDFQIAMSRVAPFNKEEALNEARSTLKGETLAIVEFLLQANARPVPPFNTPLLWFMAGITKAPSQVFDEFNDFPYAKLSRSIFTGDVPWKSFNEPYTTTRYNYNTKKSEQVPAEQKVLRLTLNAPIDFQKQPETGEGVLSKLTKLFSTPKRSSPETQHVHTLYEFLSLKGNFLSVEHNDIQRFIGLFPNNPNPLLALIASKALVYGTFSTETDKRIVTHAFESLINLDFPFSEMTHLFVATGMVTSDKTIRSFAAEMWIKAVTSKRVQSAQLGEMVGLHVNVGYAPLKRFTDLVSSNLIKVSDNHNRELEFMLSSTLMQLPSDPPVGMKRLLELYAEVLAVNGSVFPTNLNTKLKEWSGSASLKKVIATFQAG